MHLKAYLIRRMVSLLPVLFGVSLITFALSHLIPSDPARVWAGARATPEQVKIIAVQYHLNEPIYLQYFYYLNDLIHLNLGISPTTNRPVVEDLAEYFPATMELAIYSTLVIIIFGVILGVLAAFQKNRAIDGIIKSLATFGISMPIFWLGLVLQFIFYYKLGLFPYGGRISGVPPPVHVTGLYTIDSLISFNFEALLNSLWCLALPSFTLGFGLMGIIFRHTRASMLEVLSQDYITAARARGLPEHRVLFKHALKNALIPTATMGGFLFSLLLGGAVITETVFAWPGIGRYAVGSMLSLDFPAIMGVTLLAAIIYIVVNFSLDLIYVLLDPRIGY
ncbi:MAG: ABC transporter permease [Methanocellales archaeon]